ncbi:MAG: hypothetical protein IPM21_12430 [Acidobacteria bacterium]|nr:hypothetical protein [Acidobacteriota bacterium]
MVTLASANAALAVDGKDRYIIQLEPTQFYAELGPAELASLGQEIAGLSGARLSHTYSRTIKAVVIEGESLVSRTDPFRFFVSDFVGDEVPAGQTSILSIGSKNGVIASRLVSPTDDDFSIDFVLNLDAR